MSEMSVNENMNLLVDIGKALKYAEQEEAKTRHGSTPDEYHRARMLGEGFCASVAHTSIQAVRDLPENGGIGLVIAYKGKDRWITMTFEELGASNNDPEKNEALFDQWYKTLKSSASIILDPQTVQSTARLVTKKKPLSKRAIAKEQ